MTSALTAPPAAARAEDQRVTLYDVSWSDFELILQIRGDRAGVRLTYLNGALELMSPSVDHEGIKKTIARLLEAYAEEKGIPFNGFGSWTLRNAARARALEPDECYSLSVGRPTRPDLAIEVVWTSGGIDKLEVYRGLGVGEVWFWREGVIEVWVLGVHTAGIDEGHWNQLRAIWSEYFRRGGATLKAFSPNRRWGGQ